MPSNVAATNSDWLVFLKVDPRIAFGAHATERAPGRMVCRTFQQFPVRNEPPVRCLSCTLALCANLPDCAAGSPDRLRLERLVSHLAVRAPE